MTRLCLDSAPPWHTLSSAHPGGLLTLDCGEQLSYRSVHLTTADVPPELRCQGCETVRLQAVEYFTDQAARELEDA